MINLWDFPASREPLCRHSPIPSIQSVNYLTRKSFINHNEVIWNQPHTQDIFAGYSQAVSAGMLMDQIR
jgi:hypothetical protein